MAENTTAYYDRTAADYDTLHGREHTRAVELAWPLADRLGIGSVLDVGCGTGHTLDWLSRHDRSLALAGVDPSAGLLEVARRRLPTARLEVGQGERLAFADGSVDLVVATGIMHHVDRPAAVIREMFRVARVAVLISDHNNFAFGGRRARGLRLWLHASGLLGLATYVKQGFRRQGYSAEDGWWYPYSLLNNYGLLASLSDRLYLVPAGVANGADNLLLGQSHLAVVAVKRPAPAVTPSAPGPVP